MADAERTCDKCGKTFKSDGAWYAKHALKCDGTPGSTARLAKPTAERTPPAAKRPRPVSPPHLREKKRNPVVSRKKAARRAVDRPAKPLAISPVLSPATMLAALRAERAKIDVAIGAIEALA